MEKRVIITDSRKCASKNVIAIDEIRGRLSTDDYRKVFMELISLSVSSGTRLPLYEILWPHLVYHEKGALLESILLYRQLKESLKERSASTVCAKGLNAQYYNILKDICNNNQLELVKERTTGKTNLFHPFDMSNIVPLMILLLDQLIYSLSKLPHRESNLASTIVFPFPGRFDSINPILTEMECKKTIITNFIRFATFRPGTSAVEDIPPEEWATFSSVSRLRDIGSELIFLISLGYETFIGQILVRDLTKKIENNQDICLQNSIQYAFQQSLVGNLRHLCIGIIASEVFNRNAIEQVVIGGLTPRDRAIMIGACEEDIDIHYIPHTIETRFEQLPPVDLTMYVSGDLAKRHLRETYSDSQLPDIIPLGRPYLQRMFYKSKGESQRGYRNTGLNITIATQAGEDSIRRAFFRDALKGTEIVAEADMFESVNTTVKIHPNESPGFYQAILNEFGREAIKSISIVAGSLEDVLKEADLLITINSNVGLEAMLFQTPCVSINRWEPIHLTYPYALYGPVPVLRTDDEIEEFFGALSDEKVQTLKRGQSLFVKQSYDLSPDGAKLIADLICQV